MVASEQSWRAIIRSAAGPGKLLRQANSHTIRYRHDLKGGVCDMFRRKVRTTSWKGEDQTTPYHSSVTPVSHSNQTKHFCSSSPPVPNRDRRLSRLAWRMLGRFTPSAADDKSYR